MKKRKVDALFENDEARVVFWGSQLEAMIAFIQKTLEGLDVAKLELKKKKEYDWKSHQKTERHSYSVHFNFQGGLFLPTKVIDEDFKYPWFTFTFGIGVWQEFQLGFDDFWTQLLDGIMSSFKTIFEGWTTIKESRNGMSTNSWEGKSIKIYMN